MSGIKNKQSSRRSFLKQTGNVAAAATLAAGAIPHVHAAGNDTIRVALVGCGGRGTGAAINALSTKSGPVKLVAMADVFSDRLKGSHNRLQKQCGDRVDVPEDCQFIGFEAYKAAIDAIAPGGLALLTTPPTFRPLHVEYAVQKGCHVFMEKSFAVDGPGVQRILKAGKAAEAKNLKVAGGLMSRHSIPLGQAVDQIHKGAIGDVITCWAYRAHNPVGYKPRRPGETEIAHQIRNYSNFTWVNGTFILDWLIHNLDVCCWVKDAWPVSAQGQGGRQVRSKPDQLFDHIAVEYRFPDGTRLFAQGRHMANCWGFFGDIIHGAKGSAVLGEGISQPKIFKSHIQNQDNLIWEYKGPRSNQYQVEHDRLADAIRKDLPYNETERCAYACMTGILGRMAAESGKEVTWQQAMDSKLVLAPGIEHYTMETEPPVKPDADGAYPVAKPGFTKAF